MATATDGLPLGKLSIVALIALPFITYTLTYLVYTPKLKRGAGHPPTVPYIFPLVAHTTTFAVGDTKLATSLIRHSRKEAPVRLKGMGFNFVLLSGAHMIRKALTTSYLDWGKYSAPLFTGMFGGPKRISDALLHDDSGVGAKPYPGSNVHPGRRLQRNQVLFFTDAFSRSSLDALVPRFAENVQTWCEQSGAIGQEWVQLPDLFAFVKEILFPWGINALFGEHMLRLSPDLSHDFWEYDDNIPFLTTGMPSWMRPNAFKARSRCLDAARKWRKHAIEQSRGSSVPEDAAWDPAWGLGAIRRRNNLLDATEGLFDEDGRASIDLALIWSLASNVIPASFWYLFEVLASQGLLERTREELKASRIPGASLASSFDPTKLTNNDFLQAIYAETLRLHVSTMLVRSVKQSYSVDGWVLPKGQNILVSSNVEHMDHQWDATNGKHPSTEFWAERFLVDSRFSLEGKQGVWLPFGIGEHMCPGRHFAKQEMMINFAVLVSTFDFELLSPPGWRPEDNMERYGFGTQPPKQKVPFRVRRKVDKVKLEE